MNETNETLDRRHALTTAVTIAREAGGLLMDGFGREKQIERKSSALDWVTQFDKASEELIVGRLLLESGADLRYVGTACPKTEFSKLDADWLEAHGVHVE